MLKSADFMVASSGRVVVIGSNGFVGRAVMGRLTVGGLSAVGVGRPGVDLLAEDGVDHLTEALEANDTVVFVSAIAPCRDIAGLMVNLRMVDVALKAFKTKPPHHLIYISSDAVYGDAPNPVRESTSAEPNSFHGVMHLAREIAFRGAAPLAIVRPTLIFGAGDPHNGYGPNRFRRLAMEDRPILLGGEGEEMRDHIHVDDVAEIVFRIIERRLIGTVNAVTGRSLSFRMVAEQVRSAHGSKGQIQGSPRTNPISHRHFDPTVLFTAFPDLSMTSLEVGVAAIARQFSASEPQ